MIPRRFAALVLGTGLLAAPGLVSPVSAQPPAPPGSPHTHSRSRPEIRPRIGQISDEVALQRLRIAGVENPRVLRREGSAIVAQGSIGGQDATLRLDALQGRLVNTDAPAMSLAGPGAAAVERPMVNGRQLREPRSALSDPALMRDAVRP